MSERLFKLQVQYANAIYQAARFTREAEIAKAQLDELATRFAESQFARQDAASGEEKGGDRK